jgi:hypothetical protein
MSGAIPPLPHYAFMAWCSVKAQGQLYLLSYLTTTISAVRTSELCVLKDLRKILLRSFFSYVATHSPNYLIYPYLFHVINCLLRAGVAQLG